MKLSGVRVVDLSSFLPGPHLTMTMADHGAEVIKVEAPGRGDATRSIGPFDGGESVYFRNTNRGKRSIAVNLKSAAGREVVLRLAARSHVLLESYRPGVAARLGLDYAAVRAVAPQIVYCSLSAFGQDGPDRERPAHDLSVEALAGILSLGTGPDRPPGIPAVPAADVAASLMALSGILMALLRARETGEGDYLDVAMFDSLLAWTPHITGRLFADGQPPVSTEERLYGGAALYGVYATSDGGHVALGGSEIKFAENLLNALGRPDLIPLCRQPAGEAQAPVRAFLAETFAGRSRDEWTAWFADKDICFAPVLDLKEAFEGPLARQRGMLLEDGGGHRHIGVPMRFAAEPAQPDLAAPALGADGRAILADLGYDEGQVAALAADGAVALPEAG
ncbi:CaiB/BaiF CoA transferase family protein [Marinibaculum pumilum]|uniref:CaiB/BaiF CoA transferase family protein n=1 Tax=Marinibaculum pumilum TaxID=1766165 RepID=A0ABV7KVM9_9PROT